MLSYCVVVVKRAVSWYVRLTRYRLDEKLITSNFERRMREPLKFTRARCRLL